MCIRDSFVHFSLPTLVFINIRAFMTELAELDSITIKMCIRDSMYTKPFEILSLLLLTTIKCDTIMSSYDNVCWTSEVQELLKGT